MHEIAVCIQIYNKNGHGSQTTKFNLINKIDDKIEGN